KAPPPPAPKTDEEIEDAEIVEPEPALIEAYPTEDETKEDDDLRDTEDYWRSLIDAAETREQLVAVGKAMAARFPESDHPIRVALRDEYARRQRELWGGARGFQVRCLGPLPWLHALRHRRFRMQRMRIQRSRRSARERSRPSWRTSPNMGARPRWHACLRSTARSARLSTPTSSRRTSRMKWPLGSTSAPVPQGSSVEISTATMRSIGPTGTSI